MAHVLDLPGCIARANSREAALASLPDAIRAHHTWLRRHGGEAPEQAEPVTLHVTERAGLGLLMPKRLLRWHYDEIINGFNA
jgi:predicted RNase H-like HicB family nuclease